MGIARRIAVATAASSALLGCTVITLMFPDEVQEYYPEANWGSRTTAGGCPSHTPALELHAKNPNWFWFRVGVWDSKQTSQRRLTEPTVFIEFWPGWHLSIEEQKRRARVDISVTSPTPYLDVASADGINKRIPLEWLKTDYGWRSLTANMGTQNIPLDVSPQSMTVTFPNLVVNGEPVPLGTVQFTYRRTKRPSC